MECAKCVSAGIMKIARFHTFITLFKSNAITDVCWNFISTKCDHEVCGLQSANVRHHCTVVIAVKQQAKRKNIRQNLKYYQNWRERTKWRTTNHKFQLSCVTYSPSFRHRFPLWWKQKTPSWSMFSRSESPTCIGNNTVFPIMLLLLSFLICIGLQSERLPEVWECEYWGCG